MIQLVYRGERVAPLISCDVCGKQIKDPQMALVIWNPENVNRFLFVCKCECDKVGTRRLDCIHSNSIELGTWMIYLLNNIGLTGRKFKDSVRCAAILSQLE